MVVSTPTSLVMNTSSSSSNTSSLMVDLPPMARFIFENIPSLVRSRPLSRVSFFSFENSLPNMPIF
jgi:hypothetical protein